MIEIGKQIKRLSTVDSTNNYAAKLLMENKIDHGTVILAVEQLNGRGQRMTQWQSQPGMNLTASIVLLDLPLKITDQFRLSMWCALSIVECLTSFSIESQIKWPNDIYVRDRKICGTLIENSLRGSQIAATVMGIGLNVNQVSFGDIDATSIRLEKGEFMPIDDVLAVFISRLNKNRDLLRNAGELKMKYLRFLYRREMTSSFELATGKIVQGIIKNVSDSGRLEILIDNKIESFDLKEIKLLTDNVS